MLSVIDSSQTRTYNSELAHFSYREYNHSAVLIKTLYLAGAS